MMNYDTNQIRSVGSKLEGYSGDFQTRLDSINKINQDIKNNWQGASADSYIKAIEEQHKKMCELTTTISELGACLKNLAQAIEELEQSNMVSGSGSN